MALTAGRTAVCTKQPAGVVRMAAADRADVASVTVGTDNEITAITMVSTKVFWVFDFTAETLFVTEDGSLQNLSSVFDQKIAGSWQGWSLADRNALNELYSSSACGLVVIAELENGETVIFGINPDYPDVTNKYVVRMESSKYNSGAALSDAHKNDLVLAARSSSPMTKFEPGWAGVPLD
jgi:hypothetical protein